MDRIADTTGGKIAAAIKAQGGSRPTKHRRARSTVLADLRRQQPGGRWHQRCRSRVRSSCVPCEQAARQICVTKEKRRMKKNLFGMAAVVAALSAPAGTASAQDVLTGDTRLACEAILCLSTGHRPERMHAVASRYFSIKKKKLSDTIEAR
jgi:hypothetical protein